MYSGAFSHVSSVQGEVWYFSNLFRGIQPVSSVQGEGQRRLGYCLAERGSCTLRA